MIILIIILVNDDVSDNTNTNDTQVDDNHVRVGELVVAFGRLGVRLLEKLTSGLQYSCSDQEFRLFVLTTAAPIDLEEEYRN